MGQLSFKRNVVTLSGIYLKGTPCGHPHYEIRVLEEGVGYCAREELSYLLVVDIQAFAASGRPEHRIEFLVVQNGGTAQNVPEGTLQAYRGSTCKKLVSCQGHVQARGEFLDLVRVETP